MKKIFRMAVVCALAGATLLYTGCTKDYSDDISDLKDRVSSVESTVAALQAKINAGYVITGVTANAEGYLVTLSDGNSFQVKNGKDGAKGEDGKDGKDGTNGTNGTNGKDGTVVTIKNGNWYIDDKDTGVKAEATVDSITIDKDGNICINGVSTGVKAGTVAVWNSEAGTVTFKGINADGSDLVIGVCELQSIVFVPQLYLDGIEAAKYNYLAGHYGKADTKAITGVVEDKYAATPGTAAVVLAEGGKYNYVEDASYSFGEIAEAEYHVNPSSFDLTKAAFTLEGYNKEEITRAGDTSWKPVLKSIERSKDGKLAVVKYQIETPANATSKANLVSVMRLNGVLNDSKKVVSSDYEAVAPFRENLKALAFTEASAYSTDLTNVVKAYAAPCANTKLSELYLSAQDAIEHSYSVDVQYQSSMDLAKIIAIHANPAGSDLHTANDAKEVVYTLDELQKKYPELKLNFELVPYKVGANTTEEQMYGQIEGTTFYPCWVESDGKTQHRSTAEDNSGNSAVGRKPVVLVTLVDAKSNVLLYGYFKIEIAKTVKPATFKKDFIIKSFDVPYLCEAADSTTWAESSHIVLEKELNMTYAEFITRYGKYWDGKTYVKIGEDFVEVPTTGKAKDYGKIEYKQDASGNSINDIYKISFTKEQLDNVIADFKDRSVTLYAKFGASANDYVFIGLTAVIAQPAKVTFVEHNPAYWFKAADDEATDLIFVNPLVPNKTADDVTVYSNKLRNYWVENKPKVAFDATANAAYKSVWEGKPVYVHFELNKTQSCKVDGKALVVSKGAKQDTLFLEAAKKANILAFVSTESVIEWNTKTSTNGTVLSPESGIVTYYHNGSTENCTSKKVLNEYTHPVLTTGSALTETLAKDILYADVQLIATYGDCEIPCGTENFHVGFFRPVDIIKHTPKALKDAVPTGDNVVIGELFRAKDWQNFDIFTYDEKTNTYADGMYGTAVNWYQYYGFKAVNIDTKNIMSDQTGKVLKLSEVNPAAKVWLAEKATPEKEISDKIDISAGASKLGDYVFHYENNTGVVQNFNLYVPVEIEYHWGVVSAKIEIPVTATVAGN